MSHKISSSSTLLRFDLQIEARFFASLQTNETLKHLSKYVKDPLSHIDTMIRQLYIFCRGVITRDNYEILNTCLVWFSKSFVKLAFVGVDLTDECTLVRAQYQPNTVAKSFRCLFAVFKSNQVMFSLAKDFLGKGMCYILSSLWLLWSCRIVCVYDFATTTCFYFTCAPLSNMLLRVSYQAE